MKPSSFTGTGARVSFVAPSKQRTLTEETGSPPSRTTLPSTLATWARAGVGEKRVPKARQSDKYLAPISMRFPSGRAEADALVSHAAARQHFIRLPKIGQRRPGRPGRRHVE